MLRRTILTSRLNLKHNQINKRSVSSRVSRSRTNRQQQNTSGTTSNNSSNANSNANEPSLRNHALKTLLTYAIPAVLFGGFSYFQLKQQENDELKAAVSGKETFGSLLGKIMRGEWKDLLPRKEYMKVTRLNDKYKNYEYCIEKSTKSAHGGKKFAELKMDHSDALARLHNEVIITSLGNAYTLSSKSNPSAIDLSDAKVIQIITTEKEYKKTLNNIVQQEDMLMNSYRSFALYEGKSLSSVGLKNGYVNLNEDMLKQELIEIENSKKNLEDIKKKLSKIQQQKLLVEKKYIESIASVLTPEECIALAKLFESSKLSQSAAFLLYDEAPLALSVLLGIDANKLKEATDEQTEPSQEDSNEVSNVGYHTRCDPPRIFVLEFNGDTFASQVTSLREEVSCILQQSNPARGDKVILRLNSGGGTAAGYGLAASQLDRIKTVGKLPLICCIDEIAASGGYMMACVADKILASPFAIVGSVGVVATIPMFHERLKREGVEVMDVTAGKYKRTVTPYKAPTQSDRKKLEEDLAAIYSLFKSHISSQRPQLAPMIDEIATGEVWCGKHAVDKGLIDGIACFDDIIMEHINTYEVLQLKYMGKKIEEEEEKAQGMFSDSSMGAASSNAWSGIGSGLLDRCINYIGSRVLKSIMGQLESELSANSDSYRPSGHTNAASSVKTSDFMLYRGQEGP